jgi:hypothetical protein
MLHRVELLQNGKHFQALHSIKPSVLEFLLRYKIVAQGKNIDGIGCIKTIRVY